MKQFAALVQALATNTKTTAKLDAIQKYFETAHEEDKIWVVALFTGRRPKSVIKTALLRLWCMELANIPSWLFEESYHTVGDPCRNHCIAIT
jgi:DNA ligase-1